MKAERLDPPLTATRSSGGRRIDAHQHFWRYPEQGFDWVGPGMELLAGDWLPEQLQPLLAANDVDACIAVQSCGDEDDTRFLLALASEHSWIAGVVGWIDLWRDDIVEHLAGWRRQPALVGIRHQLQDDAEPAATIADPRYTHGLAAAQNMQLVYEVLLRADQLSLAERLCARHDRHWLVLDHLGKPAMGDDDAFDAWAQQIRALAAMPHVAAKLSGLVTEAPKRADGRPDTDRIRRHLDVALEAFGPARLMFGSDWPVCLLAAAYADVQALILDWSQGLSAHERGRLQGGSAEAIYRL
ncbi:amidohydrolase family protein [Solimonas marina]|uniref:Amidohydrolase family protein n=1 Tax=Solimonas marina TaxID=2714601 RepID=A0A969WG18_9GAMM|nr:amidohydrolase family protein [Solimonas marina]NKF24045.1 amidohydrolase family protein [Solimonas marina]